MALQSSTEMKSTILKRSIKKEMSMNKINRTGTILRQGWLLLVMVGLLQGCGGGGGHGAPAPVVDAVPNGYYGTNGTAAVFDDNNTTPLPINDLQGMVYNGRFIMLSTAEGMSYEGTITVSGSNYSGSVTVYRVGALVTTATVSGTINQGSTISGVLTGTGAGRGTFTLNISPKNSEVADISLVAAPYSRSLGNSTGAYEFTVADVTGAMTTTLPTTDGRFQNCIFSNSSTIVPISGQHLYTVNFTLSGCFTDTVNGIYAGMATTRNNQNGMDGALPFVASNGTNSIQTEF